ncbi:MAG: hypothetical protein HY736_01000 [Verrucomicrobia bacterium]|nr:hypothetical protein [Verrucomicrobiota bacterium]
MMTNSPVRGVALAALWSLVATAAPAQTTPVKAPAAPAAATPPIAAVATPPTIDPLQLVVDDGQLKSHPFQVFVTYPVTKDMQPSLYLTGMHWVTLPGELEGALTPLRVLPRQHRTILAGGIPASAEGTLLVFDLSRYKIEMFKSAARYWPILEWTEPVAAGQPAAKRFLAADREIYLGNMPGAALWTAVTVGFIILILLWWSVSKKAEITKFTPRPALLLITGPDGYLSLWRTQLLLWTVAVGSVVFMFGLLRLHVPEIPETLVALMGMSLLTGTASAVKAKQSSPSATTATAVVGTPAAPPVTGPVAVPAPVVFNSGRATWADLVSVWNKATGQVELSVPKAQMVFWTVIILVLFLVKSVLLGALWPVPWEMVALTGMSQAGYIGDKYVQSSGT